MISLYEYFKSKPEIIQHGFNFISNHLKSGSVHYRCIYTHHYETVIYACNYAFRIIKYGST